MPEYFQVTLSTPFGERVVTAGRNQHIWDAAQAAGISLPAICHQGRCLTCAAQLLEPGEFDARDAESYFPQDREAGFVLLCTAKPCSDLRLRTHAEAQMRRHRLKCGLPAPYA
ncbi:MAG: 2Fe-2S iron-sulfur cluster binding domain-containing protein [Acidobacteriia bacterium]|nr:2Fe-2S iron-sulfur cluster binding domain-containing protein [Terriglobia bacterium]